MNAMWSEARIKLSHRLAMHVRIDDGFFLRNRTPMVSFTFDDLPKSAVTNGARLLEEYGARGTFYVSGGEVGVDTPDWESGSAADVVDLYRRGHEIGCHTFSHIRLSTASRTQIKDEIERNGAFVQMPSGDYTMSSFAYLYGDVSITTKALLGGCFPICRGIWLGVNERYVDFTNLKAVPLERSFDHAQVLRILDKVTVSNGWVIFFTHDISEHPSPYGCKPSDLAWVVKAVLDRGIEILPIKNAAGKVRFS